MVGPGPNTRARGETAEPNNWALAGALTGHFLLCIAWLVVFLGTVFLTSSYTGWAVLVFVLGGVCWLVAAAIIVIGWESGSHWYWGVPVAWVTVFAIATVLVVAESVKSAGERPVGATATFKESADCLVPYGNTYKGWQLDAGSVDECFPTQTAAKKEALAACFNKYERKHPNHKGWPADNMRGCAWAGLTLDCDACRELPLQRWLSSPSKPSSSTAAQETFLNTRHSSKDYRGPGPLVSKSSGIESAAVS
jgi:hypothetical protein